jgi:aminoglycoside phosphotransferase (APT) family kinase protein
MAHGGFKPSQLIHDVGHVYVVDFDGVCEADPALDLGCFLAYLRPSGMYRGRRGDGELFEAAAGEFVAAYREAATAAGESGDSIKGVLERARLYEASHLFKIATRRLNRLNSPRPRELSLICSEMRGCLTDPGRWS